MSAAVDIAVVGAGAAGIAAAVCAARAGGTTVLLDQRPAAGGTGGFSGLTTLCGLYDDEGKFLNDGFAREFAEALVSNEAAQQRRPTNPGGAALPRCVEPIKMGRVWVLPYRPEKFRALAAQLVSSTPNLRAHWNSPLQTVVAENGRIVRVNDFAVGAVIDCSGGAEVARLVGAECLATDATTQAPAVVFPLDGVTREFHSATDVTQVLLPLARAGFPPLNFQASLERNQLTVKFTGPPEQVRPLIEFLRGNIVGFENCTTPLKEFAPSPRAGRMIVGQYVLTGADVRAGRKFPDAVARCAWPVEQWGADGVARFQYLPPATHYEIPARSLRAARVENLFMAGKTISADVTAIASARVMGCCLATGAAAGHLAAQHLQSPPTK